MRAAFHKTFGLARRAVLFAFGLWLAGAGCVFCCASADAAQATQVSADAEHDARASAPLHCHAHAPEAADGNSEGAAASARSTPPSGAHAGACCGKARQPSDAARKLNPATEPAATDARSEFSHADAASHVRRPAARGRSPDGRSAHVRCCVFLI